MSASDRPASSVIARERNDRGVQSPSSGDENVRVARRLIDEGFNRGNLQVLNEVLDPAFVEHQAIAPGVPPTRDAVAAIIQSLRVGFPNVHLSIEEIDSVKDRVWMRIHATGTNTGPFMGNPPTGRAMSITVFDLVRLRDGRIVEHWGVPDHGSLAIQLGW